MYRNRRPVIVRAAIGVAVASALCLGSASTALAAPVSKGGSKPGQSTTCFDLGIIYSMDTKALNQAHASGNQKAINAARVNVNSDINAGYQAGCAWAS